MPKNNNLPTCFLILVGMLGLLFSDWSGEKPTPVDPPRLIPAQSPIVEEPEVLPTEPPKDLVRELSYDIAYQKAALKGKPLLVYLTSTGCAPCKVFKQKIYSDQDAISLLSENYIFCEVNVDKTLEGNVNAAYADEFPGVKSYPAEVLIRFDNGAPSQGQILSWAGTTKIEDYLKEHTKILEQNKVQ